MMDDQELSVDEQTVIDSLRSLPFETPPASLLASFRRRVEVTRTRASEIRRTRWMIGVAAGLVVLLGGGWWKTEHDRSRVVNELRAELGAALADLSEARRFQMITTVGQADIRDGEIVDVLTTALLTDPNTNVRVAALEALAHIAGPKAFLNASSRALEQEASPFVMAMILSSIDSIPRESRRDILRALLAKPHLLPSLRAEAESRMAS